MRRHLVRAVLALLVTAATAVAQQAGGSIGGRVTDEQGAAVPGASVTATNPQTGFRRAETSDSQGLYRLAALPIGAYTVTTELQGFATVTNNTVTVNLSQTNTLDIRLKVAAVAETVSISGSGLVEKSDSSVSRVVDIRRIESLPLNGRQFANLAATLPGVGIGFHIDPTKGTNYAPQINGGAGRNVNYLVDGGDNNDDTVGGLLQQYPLEAIQEFNFQTQRFKAEYGRSNGGVMNIVTKSGTNLWSGSVFELLRDKSMNALTETERLADAAATAAGRTPLGKNAYNRNQFGGSFGGPLMKNKVQFFAALERTQQDKTQTVNTGTLFPGANGPAPIEYRENIGTGKVVLNLNETQYATVRYSRNNNSFPVAVSPTATPDSWADAANAFNSFNINHTWVLGGSKLNEFVFQYSDFANAISSRTSAPNESYPGGIQTGANLNAPQATEQRKFQFRDDFSWHVTGHGRLGHDFKAGVNFINEPRLFINAAVGNNVIAYTHLTADRNGPIQRVALSQPFPAGSDPTANIPNRQYGLYLQDDWRVSDRMTVNLGVRYDLVTGFNIDQSQNPNFVKVQAAARAGLLNNIAGLENFGLDSQSDRNNIQPRIGAVYDLKGNGRDIVRGGWGVYTDFGYTASNILFAAVDASGSRFGSTFSAVDNLGLKNPDGSFYQIGQPLSSLASQNQVVAGSQPLQGIWADPRLQQPYQMQTNLGWSHELTSDTTVSVDYVNSLGRDLNFKPRVNQLVPGSATLRRVSVLLSSPLSTNNSSNRPAISQGKSEYNALILSVRRRFSKGFDLSASYTLSQALSNIGNASDETNTGNIQDPNNPFDAPVQFGPNLLTDARHRLSLSAVVQLPYGLRVAPLFIYRSALPVNLIDGRDLNKDGDAFDIPTEAFAIDSVNPDTGVATIKSLGPCQTVNCGRGAAQSQLNLRVSRAFHVAGRLQVEAIGEIYNLFNALNPATANRTVTVPTTGLQNPALLQPQTYSGDDQRPEQRLGQIGFRLTF